MHLSYSLYCPPYPEFNDQKIYSIKIPNKYDITKIKFLNVSAYKWQIPFSYILHISRIKKTDTHLKIIPNNNRLFNIKTVYANDDQLPMPNFINYAVGISLETECNNEIKKYSLKIENIIYDTPFQYYISIQNFYITAYDNYIIDKENNYGLHFSRAQPIKYFYVTLKSYQIFNHTELKR